MAMASSGYSGINILGLDNSLLVVLMDDGLFRHNKPRSHLNRLCAQHESCGHSSAVGNSAGCDHRDLHRVHNLGYQSHGGSFADVAAGLRSLSHHGVSAGLFHHLGQSHAGNHRDYLDSRGFPHVHVFTRVSGSCGDDFYAFLHNHLRHVIRIRTHEHYVDTKWLARPLFCLADIIPDHISGSIGTANQAKSACLGHSRCQMIFRHPGHTALDDGIFNTK